MADTGTNILTLLLVVGIAAAALLGLIYVSSSFERFKRFTRFIKLLKQFGKTLNYAAYGALTIVIIVGPVLLLYYGGQTAYSNRESIYPVARWVGIILGFYVLLTIVGFVSKKKIWKKLFIYRKRLKAESYAENIKELPGVFK